MKHSKLIALMTGVALAGASALASAKMPGA